MKNNEIKRVSMEMEELEQVNGGIEALEVAEIADVAMQWVSNKGPLTLFTIGLVYMFSGKGKTDQIVFL